MIRSLRLVAVREDNILDVQQKGDAQSEMRYKQVKIAHSHEGQGKRS